MHETLADVLMLDGDNATAAAVLVNPELDDRAAKLQAALERGDADWRRFLDGA